VAVPDFQALMRPVLELLADGDDHAVKAIQQALAERFSLSREDTEEMLPGGTGKLFANRIGWATTYLYQTKLIDRPRRAVYRITERGRQVLAENPDRVDLKVLAQFEELHEFRQKKAPRADVGGVTPTANGDERTPEEQIDSAYRELRSALAVELLDRVLEQSPEFFERLVLRVLHAMGYGSDLDDPAQHLGQSGDEGVDGVIREDQLGLDLIYVQAKRWKGVVGRPEIQKFFGALSGQRATKGIFITTAAFSKEATEYADAMNPRIILVDGQRLAQLMIDHDVGVTTSRSYTLKRLDRDDFPAGDEDETTDAPPAP
jgi:restriction system protein